MNNASKTSWDRFWKDNKGKVAIWQTPNLPLLGWLVFMVASKFLESGSLKDGAEFLSAAFIFTWSYLEIKDGASYFRRLLGLVVFINLVLSHFN